LEVQHLKTLRTSKKISKGMLKQVHLNLKLMKMMKNNLYTNLLDHLTPVYIKLYNGITSLTISLGA
jgi:transcriptional antiterminator